jgi:hypothetical protein
MKANNPPLKKPGVILGRKTFQKEREYEDPTIRGASIKT